MKNFIFISLLILPLVGAAQTTKADKYRPASVIIDDQYGNLDAFGRMRVSTPIQLFDGQLTHNLMPLLYHQDTSGSAEITHDATNKMAVLSLSEADPSDYATMQTFENFRYQAGRSQYIAITHNFNGIETGCTKSIGYTDGENGIVFGLNSDGYFIVILSTTSISNDTIWQTDWNLDELDGSRGRSNPSGITLATDKTNIFFADIQALYVGRVRFGLSINGDNIYFHEVDHANTETYPYIASASLPLRAKIEATGAAATGSMNLICATVASEGGAEIQNGFGGSVSGSVTASSGARTHAITIGKVDSFLEQKCFGKIELESFDILVTGNSPVKWELVIGQALTGTNTFTDVNSTYSITEYNTAGTLSESPLIVLSTGYIPSSAASKGSISRATTIKYPIERNPDTTARDNGRITLLLTGIGGSTACQYALNWKEIR